MTKATMPLHKKESLIEKVRAGDVSAFDQLFNEYSQKLYGFALRYLKSEVDAEEIVQELFLYIWKNRKELRKDTSLQAYFFTIAYNLIKKHFRKRAYQVKYLNDNKSAEIELDTSSYESVEYRSVLEQIDKVVEELPPRRREIFVKSRKEGLNSNEIAQELGLSRGTVDNQISEALKFIRLRLQKEHIAVLLFVDLFIF
ncbi:RNA polymerase sigma-70 factor [Marinilabiliaceae bacterium JC017]|nr:RNA polymerase sigma-70 factor [Marinilabiliaceae bacterium JC017]